MRRRAGTRLRAIGWGWNHEVSASVHRKASCCAVRLGPMHMLAPQLCGAWQRQAGSYRKCVLSGHSTRKRCYLSEKDVIRTSVMAFYFGELGKHTGCGPETFACIKRLT